MTITTAAGDEEGMDDNNVGDEDGDNYNDLSDNKGGGGEIRRSKTSMTMTTTRWTFYPT